MTHDTLWISSAGDADEFLDLYQRGFVLLVAIVLRRCGGELGDIANASLPWCRRRRLAGSQALPRKPRHQ